MTLAEAWDWLASFTNLEKVPSATKRVWRLDRMNALLAALGHPEASPLTLHLAGSKGKGSTAAFLSSILAASGRTTGLYTSPHVSDWRERITHNGTFFDDRSYVRAVQTLRTFWDGHSGEARAQFIEDWGGEPTTFEWLTLAAFRVFTDEELDARVLETGLGGRLDATNAQTPTATILTLIELEHTDILGDTLTLIAGEKAGILKPGVPAFVAPQSMEVLEVFRQAARRVGSPLRVFDEDVEEWDTELSLEGTQLRLGLSDGTEVTATLPLLGRATSLNAAVAAWTMHHLARERGWDCVTDWPTAIRQGLETTRLTGRLQILSRSPWILVDGAHTSESVRLLVRSWTELLGRGGTLVFGAFEGKAVAAMAAHLAPVFDHVIVTRPGTFRPSDPEALRRAFRDAGAPWVDVAENPAQALAAALVDGGPVLVCGSFYLVGEVQAAWARTSPTP